MADEMDHNSSSPSRASLAESSATSISNAAALRFRENSRISSTQPASVHPPSTQQEPPRPTQSSRTPRESHEEQATMDTTDISIASSVTGQFNLDIAADYLGPVAYSTGETLLPLILLMITALVCYFYGKILMSLASLIAITCVQQYKVGFTIPDQFHRRTHAYQTLSSLTTNTCPTISDATRIAGVSATAQPSICQSFSM
jgi:hypothetical protein